MITLEGLTAQQVQICNLIWNCDSLDDVDRLVRNMPPVFRQDAETVKELMLAASLDLVNDVEIAQKVLVDIFGS
jgi:hypothetical protein